ncbi:2'-5' RNA ligase family protein [Paenibacillus sp. RC67]|uniref:2'-5' RNA ligase family protein n=1 Tax=Paenibacillus sp. RC67 TaxID=3039392 RepID=UPI0024ADB301|nr:2'-5' RNA ligase family protein [Paenibacillus sp. RC67]
MRCTHQSHNPLPQPLLSVHWKELEDIASQFKSFSILYGPLKNYLPHPGVCLAIEPQEQLDKLRSSLESATAFEGAKKRKYPFSAHLTLAEFIDVERTKELMIELSDSIPQGYFDCTAVSYAVPDESFRFIERARLVLG